MKDKLKGLSDKTLLIIGIILIIIAVVFLFVALFTNGTFSNKWIDRIYYFLYAVGFVFIMMAYKKKMKNK